MKDIDYAAPKTIAEACAILNEKGDKARCLAGGTDIIVQVREHRRDIDVLVDIKHIPQVNALNYDPSKGLTIGAAVPCYRIYEHKEIARAYPGLIDAAALIGGIQIQSRASLGGNLCNASPAGDTIPPLIALEATCVIVGAGAMREVPVEKFCTAPGKTMLGRGEMLVQLKLPPPKPRSGAAYLRFIPRNEMDIAVVGAGVAVLLDDSKQRCSAARIALAAVAPTPLLVLEAGAALVDGALGDALIDKAASLAQAAAKPISDMRGTAEYRKHLVGVLVKRTLNIAIQRARTG
ncbi:MAG: xanthine dehydrogenase family protein subunit M [Gemmataceae bacterium]|nr:xanthine dehydrogenase family protein subunit M [Gemmataceae bacterium]MCI0740872.1 xanthine dehydrogenase family protein subunit M [Gemmataceae bacterium]